MSTDNSGRAILFFFVKFCLLAPLCLVAWWLLLPYYGWLIGQASGVVLLHVARTPITSMTIEPAGPLNTETLLVYGVEGVKRRFPIGLLVTNVAPYIALILSTAHLGWVRRLKILLLGIAVLSLGHIVYIVLAFSFFQRIAMSREIPTALAQLFLTAPFLLWIILAYWDRLSAYFAAPAAQKDE